ncbi:hypothetical protein AAG906_027289 [Vitis piasezkii]
MGIKGVGVLLILIFSHLCFPASPSPSTHQHTIFPSERGKNYSTANGCVLLFSLEIPFIIPKIRLPFPSGILLRFASEIFFTFVLRKQGTPEITKALYRFNSDQLSGDGHIIGYPRNPRGDGKRVQRWVFPHFRENNFREGVADEKGSGAKEGRHQVIHSIKIGHGHGAAGGGGEAVASRSPGSTSNGETGNNGESTTTPTSQGGTAVIPVYTAGAVNNHRPNAHHGAASLNQQSLGPLNLCASVLAILVLHVYLVCGN